MREILFRGKNEKTGKWAFGVPLRCSCRTYIVKDVVWNYDSDGNEHLTAIGETQVDPDTVGQFTGLLDKNGNKIFEGDILKTEYSKVICEFGTGDFSNGCHSYQGWCFTDLEQDDSLRSNYNDSWYVQEYEIIGNKWDNPELLNL